MSKPSQQTYQRRRHFEQALQAAAADWFASRKRRVRANQPYILEKYADWPHNIIVPEVAQRIQAEKARRKKNKQGFALHNYIHHGLSSQAMLFNLVGPLAVQDDLDPLKTAIEAQGLTWPAGKVSASFEYEDRSVFNEDRGQPTSFDLIIRDSAGYPAIFLEAKLVEREFGGCSVFADGDCDARNPARDFSLCYLHQIGRMYWPLLAKHGFLDGPLGKEATCLLAVHYQFFREIVFALDLGGAFVLLADARSPTFWQECDGATRGLLPLLLSFVPQSLRSRVGMVTVQEVVTAIQETGRHAWITDFESKYALNITQA